MPAVEICFECSKKIDTEKEEYVVISEAAKSQGTPRSIAHLSLQAPTPVRTVDQFRDQLNP
jgi:hypothetical protein